MNRLKIQNQWRKIMRLAKVSREEGRDMLEGRGGGGDRTGE